ncbi:hypothetical protein MKW98_026047 [Papaver atlanticum]|uniref:Uncharacterized protein n=1 Tax=Papaver atlanticum TaxID=357466 RepID=A0AAD4RY04_9MAGN|nr:hypothetical protein MKW98_026047 [Papaver atlanticum]
MLLPYTSAQSDNDDAIALAIQCGYELLYGVILMILCVIIRWLWVIYYNRRRHISVNRQRRHIVVPRRHNNNFTRGSAATRKRGLDLKVIETFPVFKHPDVKNTENVLECAVCLSRFEDGDVLRLLGLGSE